jgi:hypothetical protein
MGEAKEIIKGSGSSARSQQAPADTKNLMVLTQNIMNEVSNCIVIKDHDTQTEGENAKADNIRKAALLRSCYTLLKSAKILMEDY